MHCLDLPVSGATVIGAVFLPFFISVIFLNVDASIVWSKVTVIGSSTAAFCSPFAIDVSQSAGFCNTFIFLMYDVTFAPLISLNHTPVTFSKFHFG